MLLLSPLHTLQEATGEEDHRHEQDNGAADDGGDHSHPEAKVLMSCHSYERQDQFLGMAHPGPAVVAQPALSKPHSVGEAGRC